jgi:predicted nuclease of predicted toxin-antitoxin system
LKFLVDNQLPSALARFLAGVGTEAVHVLDLGLAQSGDAELWSFAVANKFVLISKDHDFLHFLERTAPHGQLIWVRVGNCRRQALLEVVERVWPETLALVTAGERLIEIR